MGNKYNYAIEDGPGRDELIEAFKRARERKIVAPIDFTIIQEYKNDLGEYLYRPIKTKYVRIRALEHDDEKEEFEEYGYKYDKKYDKDTFMIKGRMFVCVNPKTNPDDDMYEKSTFWASYNTRTHEGRIIIEAYE